MVVEDGRPRTIDAGALVAEVRAMEPGLRRTADDLRRRAAELEPFYRFMPRRSASVDVGFTRWVGH